MYKLLKCPICGSLAIVDSVTSEFVCPNCGLVLERIYVPSYTQLRHTAPIHHQSSVNVPPELIEKAKEILGEKALSDIKKLGKNAQEIVDALEYIVSKRKLKIPWSALRKAYELAEKHTVPTHVDELRTSLVKEEIESLIEKYKLSISPYEVLEFALKNRNIWSGRKAKTVAYVFLYLYMSIKYNRRLSVPKKYEELALKFKGSVKL